MTLDKITEITCDCGSCDCSFRGTADQSMAETRIDAREAGWREEYGMGPDAGVLWFCPDDCADSGLKYLRDESLVG